MINVFLLALFLLISACGGKEEAADISVVSGQSTDPGELTQSAVDKQTIGAYEEAVEILNKALEINSQFVAAHYQMGQVYEEWDKRKEAIQAYKKTLEIEPSHIEARLGLASVYTKLHQNEQAIVEYRKVAAMKPNDPEIPFKIALQYWYLQNLPQTAGHYRKVIEIDPEHLQAHLNLASVYERMKDWKNALKEIEIAKRLGSQTGNPEAVSIAEKKLPFIRERMNMTAQDLKRKSEPPFE